MNKQKLVGFVARRGETIVRDFALPGEQHALADGYEWMPVYSQEADDATRSAPAAWASFNGNDLTAFYAFDPGAGAEPLYRIAPPSFSARVAWNAAVTLANNICVDESNRVNDDDGPAEVVHMASECARRIRGWLDPTEEQFKDLIAEASGGQQGTQ